MPTFQFQAMDAAGQEIRDVIEAATDLRLTVDKTETMLRDLSARGYAEVRVSESGLLVYHFHEIERADEKPHARSVDEL